MNERKIIKSLNIVLQALINCYSFVSLFVIQRLPRFNFNCSYGSKDCNRAMKATTTKKNLVQLLILPFFFLLELAFFYLPIIDDDAVDGS